MLKAVIIVAGGLGKRMNATLPKQFITIADKPILMHTINCFAHFDSQMQIILVLPQDYFELWHQLCTLHNFNYNITLVQGGKERFHSVKNGLEKLNTTNGIVAIHDGVRPFVSKQLIDCGIKTAEAKKTAIPAILPSSSVRLIDNKEQTYHFDRSKVRLIQTPQFFDIPLLLNAYKKEYSPDFTDDASVLEHDGQEIFLFDGDEQNIKITTKFDLDLAQIIIKKNI